MTGKRLFPIIHDQAARSYFAKINQILPRPEVVDEKAVSLTSLILSLGRPPFSIHNAVVNGYRAPSAYSVTSQSMLVKAEFPPYKHDLRLSGGRLWEIQTTGRAAGWVTIPQLPSASADEVWMKVRNKVKDETFDVAMVLAEIGSTANTISSNLMRVARSMDTLRRRKPYDFYYLMNGRYPRGVRKTDRRLRQTASTYLEWKYGIMPTIFDIEGGCDTIEELSQGSFFGAAPIISAKAKSTKTGTFDLPVQCSVEYLQFNGIASYEYERGYFARIDYNVTTESLRGLSRFGIGLSTLATVAFERTPFSFVLNMAVPIADIIKSWDALAGVTVKGISLTDYTILRGGTVKGTAKHSAYGYTVPFLAGVTEGKTTFRRTIPRTVPIPMPFIRNPIKTGNLATVLALFTQMRK